MKNFITVNDIEYAIGRGETVLHLLQGDVVTAAAREFAQSKGVTLQQGMDISPKQQSLQQASAPVSKFPPYYGSLREEDILRWREEFPLLKEYAHVANCSVAAQSHRVRSAVNRYLDNWLTSGMDWDYWMVEINKAKAEFAKLIGASPEEIAINGSVSEAVASIASGLDISGSRKKVVTTEIEFPTVGHVWLAHQKYGYNVQFIPAQGEEIPLDAYDRYVDGQTLLTSITHVYYRNGFKQDIGAIADICHRKGSLVLVDAYQGCGTEVIDVKKQNIDILTSGCIKFLFGVPGIAFTYVNRDLVPLIEPAFTGWFGQENPFAFEVRKLNYASDARRFDTGTPAVLTSFAAGAGIRLANDIGVKGISERIDYLSQIALTKADALNLNCVSPRDIKRKGSTTAIQIEMDSHHMEAELKKRKVIASARGNVIRIAPHFYTMPGEVEYAIEQVRNILDGH